MRKIIKLIKEENFQNDIFKEENKIKADRHTVYSFVKDDEQYIIKLFKRDDRYENELQGYTFSKEKDVKTYSIIEMATTELGKKFIIMSKIPGENGEIAVNESNIKEILYQMGENLGLLHTNRREGTPGHKERLGEKVTQLSNILKEDQIDIGEEYEFLQKACNQCANLIDKLSFDDVIFGYGHGDFGFQNIMVQDNILTGIFDFEMSGYTNTELDLIQMYRKHLYTNSEAEKAFFGGYCNHMLLPKGFNDRKYVYMMLESIINCSWSFNKNRDYYNDNIKFLEKILL